MSSSLPPIRKDLVGLLQDLFERLGLVERRLARPGPPEPAPTRGSTSVRDTVYPVPTTDPQRVALAAQKLQWFNTDKGWTESYYATTGTAGLTVPGLLAGHAPGWYPVAGSALFARRAKTDGYQNIAANTVVDPILAAMSINRGGFTGNATSGITVPVGGYYRGTAVVYYTGGSSPAVSIVWVRIYNDGVLMVDYLEQRNSIGNDTMIAGTGIYPVVAGKTTGSSALTNGTGVAVYGINSTFTAFELEYLGPPLVNG